MTRKWIGFCLLLTLIGCSGLEESEKEKLRMQNAKAEFIYRLHDESHYLIKPPEHRQRELYPWESAFIGSHPKITKDFFRCKGSSINPIKTALNRLEQTVYLFDCGGCETHSLPLKGNDEFIYPVLIDLLNYIQFRTNKQVIITCGHRCPSHNQYADSSNENQYSKHQVGAEVDFYVKGMEKEPMKIIDLIQNYYAQNPLYEGKGEYFYFQRYQKSTDVSTFPWYNKEVFLKLYKRKEGRDLDNTHGFPYLSIQVRYNREEGRAVNYNWHAAFNGFRRS